MSNKSSLDSMCPAGANSQIGTKLDAIITLVNELKSKHNSLLAKLDADAGVTDVNYAATQSATNASITVLN